MNKRSSFQKGFSLIELAVVMALIGITSAVAAVYISSSETELRKTVRNIRFDLERARMEALSRNTTVYVTGSFDVPTIDCNKDGLLDEKDRCYVIYEDSDNNGQYTQGNDSTEEIQTVMTSSSINIRDVEGSGDPWFSPTGRSNAMTFEVTAAIKSDSDLCTNRCLLFTYPISISAVGRVEVGDKEESTADCNYCDSCGDCL